MVTTQPCVVCGRQSQVEMTEEELAAFRRERFIQDALPHWPADQRELLISGTHPACWTTLFGPEE